jgi:hypothetical protein
VRATVERFFGDGQLRICEWLRMSVTVRPSAKAVVAQLAVCVLTSTGYLTSEIARRPALAVLVANVGSQAMGLIAQESATDGFERMKDGNCCSSRLLQARA